MRIYTTHHKLLKKKKNQMFLIVLSLHIKAGLARRRLNTVYEQNLSIQKRN